MAKVTDVIGHENKNQDANLPARTDVATLLDLPAHIQRQEASESAAQALSIQTCPNKTTCRPLSQASDTNNDLRHIRTLKQFLMLSASLEVSQVSWQSSSFATLIGAGNGGPDFKALWQR